ncbi:MAG: hypothetical protein N2515_08820, partial [Deltaproteobacteria bacterium]|nr:hypothetical protein [Deltaproteobacteria bacterium]
MFLPRVALFTGAEMDAQGAVAENVMSIGTALLAFYARSEAAFATRAAATATIAAPMNFALVVTACLPAIAAFTVIAQGVPTAWKRG